MAVPNRRSNSPPDPARQQLVEVRRGFFRLHKALVDHERAALTRRRGITSPAEFLQALIGDPELAWLQPFTTLLVRVDEALAARDEPLTESAVRRYIEEIRMLVAPAAGEVVGSERYEEVYRRDPDVLVAHVELTDRMGATASGEM